MDEGDDERVCGLYTVRERFWDEASSKEKWVAEEVITKSRERLLTMIEGTSERNEKNIEQRSRRRAKPREGLSRRAAKEYQRACLYQTPLGHDGETNFMSLPGELRNEIYRLALVEDHTLRIHYRKSARPSSFSSASSPRPLLKGSAPWREPGLLRVNKAVRTEASSVYYGLNDFSVYTYPEDLEPIANWLGTIISRCGNDPFRHLHFFVVTCKFYLGDLYSMLPLVQVFADTGLEIRPGTFNKEGELLPRAKQKTYPYKSSSEYHSVHHSEVSLPLFVLSESTSNNLDLKLLDAVDFGVQAYMEGWRSDWVIVKFEEWFDRKIEPYLGGYKGGRQDRRGGNYGLRDRATRQRTQKALESV